MAKTVFEIVKKHNFADFCTQSSVLNDFIINIILVAIGARSACLLESANMETQWSVLFPQLKKLIRDLGLHQITDPLSLKKFPRIFVYSQKISKPENSRDVGRLLGITYLRDDYLDYHKPRYGIHIKVQPLDVDIFSQVVVDLGNNNLKSHLMKIRLMKGKWQKKWKQCIPECKNFKFQVSTTFDAGIDQRYKKLKENNDKYMKQNIELYLNDMYNFSQENIQHDDKRFKEKMIEMYESLRKTKNA